MSDESTCADVRVEKKWPSQNIFCLVGRRDQSENFRLRTLFNMIHLLWPDLENVLLVCCCCRCCCLCCCCCCCLCFCRCCFVVCVFVVLVFVVVVLLFVFLLFLLMLLLLLLSSSSLLLLLFVLLMLFTASVKNLRIFHVYTKENSCSGKIPLHTKYTYHKQYKKHSIKYRIQNTQYIVTQLVS